MNTEIVILSEHQHFITNDLANHYKILPKSITNEQVEFYVENAFNTPDNKEELELLLGKQVAYVNVE
jgi:general secretion pathway protein E/type IV pilus assembly protein PilB